jgi:hypothetical protein
MWLNRIHRAVENVRLVYLGLLPALATFSALLIYGNPVPLLLFLGSVVFVSAYLAVVANYTRPTNSLFALIAVESVLLAFWPYLCESVFGGWLRLLFLVMGIVEAFVACHYLLKVDRVVRDHMSSAMYIVIFLFVWIAAFSAGNILHEMGGG